MPPDIQGTEQQVPTGHALTFDAPDGSTVEIPFAQATIIQLETEDGKVHLAVEISAQDAKREGQSPRSFQFAALLPAGAASMTNAAGLDLPAEAIALFWPDAPLETNKVDRPVSRYVLMAEGRDASIYFDDITPTKISGRFSITITDENKVVWKIKDGRFDAYRGPTADDATFAHYWAATNR